MAPYGGSLDALSMQQSTNSNPASGDELDFVVNVDHSVLDQILPNGNHVDLWDGTLVFVFGSQQSTVKLTFGPSNSSYAIEGTYTDPNGAKVQLTPSGNAAVATLPSSSAGSSFTFELGHIGGSSAAPSGGGQGGPSSLRVLKARMVFTVDQPDPDPDALPHTDPSQA